MTGSPRSGSTIRSAEVLATSPTRNVVTLRVTTEELMQHSALTNEVSRTSYTWTDGYLHPGDQPGLGVHHDDHAAAQHPYEAAYLPFNRPKDGTIHDW